MKKKLPKSRAFSIIIFSTALIFSLNFLIIQGIQKYKKQRLVLDKYNITKIAQVQKDINLDSQYLAELLNLSKDKNINIFLFDTEQAKEKLMKSYLIKNVNSIKKLRPDCIYLDIDVRKPIAILKDFDNLLIDEDKNIFPFKPFFKNLDLVHLIIGLDDFKNFCMIDKKEAKLSLDILNYLKKSSSFDIKKIKLIDSSNAYNKSYGKRQIIIQTEEEIAALKGEKKVIFIFPMVLRFSPDNYHEQLQNYLSLKEKILKDYENQIRSLGSIPKEDIVRFDSKTIDLRISKLAFIDK
jgi:cell division septal protein FtsQ